jgi:hypothetical protein
METSDCRRLYLASEAEGALACVVKPHVGVRTVVGVFCSRLRVSITLDLGFPIAIHSQIQVSVDALTVAFIDDGKQSAIDSQVPHDGGHHG